MFISSLLLLFLSIKESVGRMILLGSVLLLKSLPRHHRGNNSKEVFFFEENILRHANEKSQYIFYQVLQIFLKKSPLVICFYSDCLGCVSYRTC